MRLRPQPLPPVPEATAAAVQAAFPKGHLYVELRAEFGRLYDDQLFADRYPPQGRPAAVAPWPRPMTWRPAIVVNATPIGWAINFTSPRPVIQASLI